MAKYDRVPRGFLTTNLCKREVEYYLMSEPEIQCVSFMNWISNACFVIVTSLMFLCIDKIVDYSMLAESEQRGIWPTLLMTLIACSVGVLLTAAIGVYSIVSRSGILKKARTNGADVSART